MNIRLKKLDNQDGLVSIIVTMLIMSLLTLVAIGFANLATREQRQALDMQLSTQAFYAAESGANFAIDTNLNSTTCTTPRTLGNDDTVASTCIIVEDKPESLIFDDVGTEKSTVIPIDSQEAMSELKISWSDANGGNTFVPNCNHDLLSSSEWVNQNIQTGMIRMMLIPRDNSIVSRDSLIANTTTSLLNPSDGCGANIVNYRDKGGIVDGRCDTANLPRYCSAIIRFPGPAVNKFVLRLKGIYRPSKITITGVGLSGGNPVRFANTQIHIDSTGRANDVLRRIRVAAPIDNEGFSAADYPEFALETAETLCKRFSSYAGTTNTDTNHSAECAITP